MLTTLMAKTFALLSMQLTVTLLAVMGTTLSFRWMHEHGHPQISATTNSDGQLDLHVNRSWLRPAVYTFLVLDIVVFIALLLFGRGDLTTGVLLLGLWSVINGVQLSLVFINVDENIAARVMTIAVSATIVCALFGMYSGIDVSGMGGFLYVLLLVLLAGNIVRLFVRLGDTTRRIYAGFGVLLFLGYLVFDFNMLSRQQAAGVNDWGTALLMTINIYLDIINLILYLLDLMSQ